MSAHKTLHPAQAEPLHAHRLIIATNRGPVEFYLTQDKVLKSRRGAGGVVTALIEAASRMEVTWVAMAMTEGDRLAARSAEAECGRIPSPLPNLKMQLRYVVIPKTAYRKHYDIISNRVLWFLQHYLYDPSSNSFNYQRLQDAWRNGYRVANQAIAEAVNAEIERAETTPVVMLHDYHLYLVAAMIRERHPSIITQQFIHIPWPDSRCWHFLPSNITQEIYRGLVGNDIVGFQTERDARNFLEGARTILEGAEVDFEEGTVVWQGHRTLARAYPISISVTEERRIVQSLAGRRAAEKILPLLGEQTIMRVDRIEPTKNIPRGFQAYAQMLEEHPELRGKVKFLAFLVPSRQSLPEYKRLNSEVLKLVEEINARYGDASWKPIEVFCDNDRTRALAAMQFYDVLLVNPIIDGMNLVAKEGAVVNKRNGLLVLSRTAGAFQQLGKAAIPTSPLDVAETAEALYTALTLPPEERERRARLARQIVEQNNLQTWLTRQIEDINELLDLARLAAENEERQREQSEPESEPELAPSPLSLSAG
ncbi:alpha,alpha-trehalose-phosphate synthase (UDP-forming) [Thermogemmatispora aurantia]|jgi:trehalose 6-phosphate synthase|nr:trehalose-6-phosphate synthase [Thermogemmatispora aurantia]